MRGDDIVQESIPQAESPLTRWSSRDITGDSFVWLDEAREPDGAWFFEQRMIAKRT
ncbi:MAG: hypothetical protein JXA87_01810 [Thermoleophilia bacterium]|nr:hypothetical protein [Thermoleophilia bacterium]